MVSIVARIETRGLSSHKRPHLLLDDHDLLGRDVLKGEHKPPVEVTLSVHGAIVDIGLLGLVLSTQPATTRERDTRVNYAIQATMYIKLNNKESI